MPSINNPTGGETSRVQPSQEYMPQPCYEEDEIDLLDLLLVLVRNKKRIFFTAFAFALVAAIWSLIMTPVYRSSTQLLPPSSGSGGKALALMAQMGVPDFAAGMLGVQTPADLLVAIAKSRPVLDEMIRKYDLASSYFPDTPKEEILGDDVRNILSEKLTALADTKTGIITLSMEDEDPAHAAELANGTVEILQSFLKKQSLGEASQQRLFLEQQLKETQMNLLQAENALVAYQKKSGVLDVESQTTQLFSSLGTLRAKIAEKEVEYNTAKSFATGKNPEIQRLQAELASLRQQLKQMESQTASEESLMLPLGLEELPDAGVEYLRLMRDFKFHEAIYGMLL
ncbi:MAG TPA: Wzz/FepE/Etk N-terminal domain-containing protein, partial [Synergistaceae bacterium]|nr:Wzz/FepE/Etk N-terminal domain-containing protein [Synergistaceae bacterium]